MTRGLNHQDGQEDEREVELDQLAADTAEALERAQRVSRDLRQSMDQLSRTLAESEHLVEKLHTRNETD